MSSIFDWEVRRLGMREVRRLGMRERVKTRNDNGLRIWIFSQKLPFSVEQKMFQRHRKWAHKIGKLQEPPTRNIPCLNV